MFGSMFVILFLGTPLQLDRYVLQRAEVLIQVVGRAVGLRFPDIQYHSVLPLIGMFAPRRILANGSGHGSHQLRSRRGLPAVAFQGAAKLE